MLAFLLAVTSDSVEEGRKPGSHNPQKLARIMGRVHGGGL
jgi:hypothetical protein